MSFATFVTKSLNANTFAANDMGGSRDFMGQVMLCGHGLR